MGDLLQHTLKVPDQKADISDSEFLRTTFINAVRSMFIENGWIDNKDTKNSGGNFLLGFNSNLYEIQDDFSILDCPDFGHAIGSGETASRASLFTTRNYENQTQRVLLALEAAEAIIPSVRGPFSIMEI
jgi:hypothetical protein